MQKAKFGVIFGSALAMTIMLSGCDKEPVGNESFTGVPHNGQTCKEFYSNQANQAKCIQQDGRGGK